MTIHPHSSANSYFIYCVGQCPIKISAFKSAMVQSNICAKPLLGRYQGQDEQSFISSLKNLETIAPWLVAEESILLIHDFDSRDRPKATLKYLASGEEHYVGKMVAVSRSVALRQANFTYDITYKNYFVCQSEDSSIQQPITFRSQRSKVVG
ncbi:MAG: hypothetical protein ABJN52_04280 [Litorimonas sp.]